MFNFFSLRAQKIDSSRYQEAYSRQIENKQIPEPGLINIPEVHRKPFYEYYKFLEAEIYKTSRVLELGSGAGIHTSILCDLSEDVTALDISNASLQLCRAVTRNRCKPLEGSIDAIPVPDNSYDVVVSCGSLSYANWKTLTAEIIRVTKPGGKFIFLDSVNGNPIYIGNRIIHVLRRRRTLATVLRIPTKRKIGKFMNCYEEHSVLFMDKWLWLYKGQTNKMKNPGRLVQKLEEGRLFESWAFKVVGAASGLKKK